MMEGWTQVHHGKYSGYSSWSRRLSSWSCTWSCGWRASAAGAVAHRRPRRWSERRTAPASSNGSAARHGKRKVDLVDLLVIRHAIAEDREAFARTGRDDGLRPLTAKGRRRFEASARGLRTLVETIDVLATSTLARAIQTGELLAGEYELRRPSQLPELAPEADPASLSPWLRKHRARSTVAIVGHEPHLSQLVEYLLTGSPGRGFVSLAKGGACRLALGEGAQAGRAGLRWLLTAAQLRRMG